MLSTGDVQGCLRKLETLLRAIKYPGNVDYSSLSRGDPSALLPILGFSLTSFSPALAKQLMEAGLELAGKTDLRFTDTLYKLLRDIFQYKPVLTKQQFLQLGFSQRKISMVCDIINLVVQKHSQLKKPSVRCLAPEKGSRGHVQPALTEALTVSDRPVVITHTDCHSTFHLNSPVMDPLSSSSPGNGTTEPVGDKGEVPLYSAEVNGRLSALENQLQGLQAGLDRFRVLEKRLEDLERKAHTVKRGSDMVIVSRESWEDLRSRVLLLETRLELGEIQLSVQPPWPLPLSSSTMTDSSEEDLKERLERITNMLKSTSSLLKNIENTSTNSSQYVTPHLVSERSLASSVSVPL
ncbi:centrosomal protein of 44 kDa [Halichoeres trimaculatus]|uniref:centrosomal protein of 44 kDa n=1 Tax=Halichoeres trimaculatus TaxID=147232 RepID=UPI003D9E7C94